MQNVSNKNSNKIQTAGPAPQSPPEPAVFDALKPRTEQIDKSSLNL